MSTIQLPVILLYDSAAGQADEPIPADLIEVAPGLAEQLQAAGWQSGPAAQLTALSLHADLAAVAEWQCEECGEACNRVELLNEGQHSAGLPGAADDEQNKREKELEPSARRSDTPRLM